ncbi:MAG: sigma-70 family RNA polymerase sigma factor, partial [Planctomycetota bacterium]
NRTGRTCVQTVEGSAGLEAAAKATGFEDALLVQRVQAGEMTAFTELVRRYQDRVFNAVWRICGNAEDARDVTQDAFLKAYESIASFRGQSGFYTWLFRIAVNLAISHRRSMKRRPTQSLDAVPQDGLGGSQAASLAARMQEKVPHNPAHEAMSSEIQGHVVAALHKLDDEFRSVIVLRDIEGFDYGQIAEVLDIAPGTVKSRLHRARLALRKLLAPMLGQEV